MDNLSLFNRFYQNWSSSTAQKVSLKKTKEKYLLPVRHPQASIIQAAVNDAFSGQARTKTKHFDSGAYVINDAKELLIRSQNSSCQTFTEIPGAPVSPPSSSMLRVVMNHRLKDKVRELDLDIVIPDEYLVENPHEEGIELTYENFSVVSEKLEIIQYHDMHHKIGTFSEEQQKKMAHEICRLIYHSGFMDAHTANIVLTNEDKLAIVDTEGHSLFYDRSQKSYKPISLLDARIVGLKEFINRTTGRLPEVFIKEAKTYLFYAKIMKVIRTATIVFSILCPIIPLAVLIASVVTAQMNNFIGWCCEPAEEEVAHSLVLEPS